MPTAAKILDSNAATNLNPARLIRVAAAPIVLTSIAVIASLFPGVCDLLQFDRAAIARGEVWRVVTGNFVHWNADHLIWDSLMFFILGLAIELRSRHRHLESDSAIGNLFVLTTVASAIAVSACVWFFTPLERYRGLSGIDSALFVLLAAWYLVDVIKSGAYSQAAIPSGLLLCFLAKIGYEIATGHTYFVDSTAAAFVPLPQVHLAGAGIGVLFFALVNRTSAVLHTAVHLI